MTIRFGHLILRLHHACKGQTSSFQWVCATVHGRNMFVSCSQTKTFKELDSSDDSAGEVDSPCLSSRSGSVFRKSESIQSSIESMSQESAFFVPMDGAMPDTALSSSSTTTTTKTVATGTKVNEIVDGRVWRSNSFVNGLNGDSSSCCDSSLVPDEEVNGGISTTSGNLGSDTKDDDRGGWKSTQSEFVMYN